MLSTPRSHPVQRNLRILGNLFSLHRASPIWVTIAKRKWDQIGIFVYTRKQWRMQNYCFSRNLPVQIYKKDTLIIFSLPIILFQTEVKLLLYTVMFVDNNNNPNTIIRIKIFGNYIRSQKCDKYIFPPKSPISPLCLHYTEIK